MENKEVVLLEKLFPVEIPVTISREQKVVKRRTNDEGKVKEHYYAKLSNYINYKNQLDNPYIDFEEMEGLYPYEPEELSFEYKDLTKLDSIILQYDEKTNSYNKLERLVQRLSKAEQVEDNRKNNITEYWDISALSQMQQDEIQNILGGAVETFEINNNRYTKLEKSKTL